MSSESFSLFRLPSKSDFRINRRDKCNHGRTRLLSAVLAKNSRLAKRALDRGADPNIPDDSGQTPLMAAAVAGDFNLVFSLLSAKAKPNLVDDEGQTALMKLLKDWVFLAYGSGKNRHSDVLECLQSLTMAGADFNLQDVNDKTALMLFVEAPLLEAFAITAEVEENMGALMVTVLDPLFFAEEDWESKKYKTFRLPSLTGEFPSDTYEDLTPDIFLQDHEGMTALDIAKKLERKVFITELDYIQRALEARAKTFSR